tara:strand:+ start:269 stop:553 length:285 start_codon:yes stop_codon:yes gene_type:complete
MNFYKKAIFSFILVIFFFVIAVKLIEPVIERQIKNTISDKKLSEKLKKELQSSVEDFTPEKREFYKQIIKQTYKKWKPVIDEALNEAKIELSEN